MAKVISLGGSLVCPDKIDLNFLKNFIDIIKNTSEQIGIIVGGGKTCRLYQSAAKELGVSNNDSLDRIGINSTKLNASLISEILGISSDKIIQSYSNIALNNRLIIGGGELPGHSTDYDAVLLAKQMNADIVINLSDIDFLYDKDPKKFKDAKEIKKISWEEYNKKFSKDWNPGSHTPFDPIAAELASKLNLKVIIANGKDIENLKEILNNKEFKGTIIG